MSSQLKPMLSDKHSIKDQTCKRCIQDLSVPGIYFDSKGICNFCHLHDSMDEEYPNDYRGKKKLDSLLRRLKQSSKNKKYNCVLGLSGGRDSSFLLWLLVKKWRLNPLAVHFNDGFDHPVAGENMLKACKKLNVDLITVTSHWKEAKDLKIDFLKASTPDLNLGTDIGIAAALYGMSVKHNIKHILLAQSFRTEGIKPLHWSYFDGDYLRNVHNIFGTVPLSPFLPERPGFHLGVKELMYYSLVRKIFVWTPLYYYPYVRKNAEDILKEDLSWVYPGAHYFDDLYHSLIKYIHRVKFNIDLNMNSDSALVRSGQMSRETALIRKKKIYHIEDEDTIRLCLKRLNLSKTEFEDYMAIPTKTFKDYPTSWNKIKNLKFFIRILSHWNLLPKVTYKKYFQ